MFSTTGCFTFYSHSFVSNDAAVVLAVVVLASAVVVVVVVLAESDRFFHDS